MIIIVFPQKDISQPITHSVRLTYVLKFSLPRLSGIEAKRKMDYRCCNLVKKGGKII